MVNSYNEIFKYLPLPGTLKDTSLVNANFQQRVKSFVCWFYNKNHSDIKIKNFEEFVGKVSPLSNYARDLIYKNICNISQAKEISDFKKLGDFEKLKKIMEKMGCTFSSTDEWDNKDESKNKELNDFFNYLYRDLSPKEQEKNRLNDLAIKRIVKNMKKQDLGFRMLLETIGSQENNQVSDEDSNNTNTHQEKPKDKFIAFWIDGGLDILHQALCEELLTKEDAIKLFTHWNSQIMDPENFKEDTSIL